MFRNNIRGARPLLACVSTLALAASLPGLAAAQAIDVGAPGKALTTGVVQSSNGGVSDSGANGFVDINAANTVATAVGATINSTTANSYGLTASSTNSGQVGGLVSLTLTGVNTITGPLGAVAVHGVSENAYLNTATGGGVYTGGIEADSQQGSASVINGANTIIGSASQVGIAATSGSLGAVIIDSTGGSITAGTGLQASSTGGSVTIGENNGITTAISNIGANTVGVAAFTSGAGAINVKTGAGGTIDGGGEGILASTNGSGSVTVNVGAAIGASTALSSSGVDARSGTGAISVTSTAAITTNGGSGISASSGGAVTINASAVTNNNGQGIYAFAGNTLTINAGAVTSTNGTAINGAADTGEVVVTTTGPISVNATPNSYWDGIFLGSGAGEVDVTLNAKGPLTATFNAIDINTVGTVTTGAITVNATGAINSIAGGISAVGSGAGAINLGTANAALGAIAVSNGYGILATGPGDINIYTGAVTASGGVAASFNGNVSNGAVAAGVTVNNNQATLNPGTGYGVAASDLGSGKVTINAGGAVTGGNAGGILAKAGAGAVSVTTLAVTAGAGDAIEADSTGGAISVTANGAVSGTNYGVIINDTNTAASGAITVNTTSTVNSGSGYGIGVRNLGLGLVSLGSANQRLGAVTSKASTGVFATSTGDISIYASDVTGATRGIVASNQNSGANGAVLVDVSGAVNAANGAGLIAQAFGTASKDTVTVRANTITSAGGSAVSAEGMGGDISVTTTGAILANPGGGQLWDGLFAQNDGSANVIVNASGPVTGSFNAIEANANNGAVTVAASGVLNGGWGGVVSESDGTGAINLGSATARLGAITTTSGVGVYAKGTSDINVYTGVVTASGGADVTLTNNMAGGVVQASGPNMSTGYGVAALSSGGNVVINASGLVTGGTAGGVLAQILTTAGNLSITTNGVAAATDRGVEADANGGAVTITNNGAVSAGSVGVFATNTGAGTITILGAGAVNANGGTGVYAGGSGLGAISIGTVSQRYSGSITSNTTGVFAAGAGDVKVYAGAVTGGTRGIVAANQGTGAVNGAVVVDVSGPVVGQSSYGIIAVNNGLLAANTILVNAGQVTANNGTAISAQGDGDITINASGPIVANAGASGQWDGIYAAYANSGGDSLITVNTTGAVTGSYNGIEADSSAASARSGIAINAGGSVTGGSGVNAILATMEGQGSVGVNTVLGATLSAAGGNGVLVNVKSATGANNVAITNLATIGGAGSAQVANGIVAEIAAGNAGAISLNSTGAIHATNAGIMATTAGSGSINIGGSSGIGGTISTAGSGIYASATSGNVSITTAVGGQITGGAQVGVDARTTTGAITLNLNGNIGSSASGDTVGLGVSAQIASGAADININASGGIYVTPGSGQSSAGILAINKGTGAIHVTSSGVVDPGAYGVVIQGAGPVSYAQTSGSTQGAQGLWLASTGAGAVSLTTASGSSIIGTAGDGVDVSSQGGALALTLGGNTTGSASGVNATTTGAGTTNLAITGSVASANGPAVVAVAGTGGLTLNLNGNVTSANGPAVNATSAGAATVTIGANAVVTGKITTPNSAVINLATASGQTSTLTIASGAVVQAASGSTNTVAIRATGGSVNVTDNGTVTGTIDFSALTGANTGTLTASAGSTLVTSGTSTFGAGNDTYNNVGVLAGTGPTTTFDFAGGTNVFNNSGTVEIGFNPVLNAGSTFFIKNLTTFNNSGLLLMANGVVGDSINMAGASYVGSGAAKLSIDTAVGSVTSAAPRSDTLVLGASSGKTTVAIHDTTGGFGAYNPAGIPIVIGATHKGDFVLDSSSSYYNPNLFGGAIDKPGLFFSQLAVTPAATVLVSAPKVQVYQFATLASQLETLWYATAAKTDRQADLRDQLASGAGDRSSGHPGFWAKIDAATADRDVTQTYSAGPASYSYDASYKQDIGELSFGYDGVQRSRTGLGGFSYGLYGGYVTSNARFDVDSTHIKLSGWSLNGYGSYVAPNGLYASGSVGGEWLRAKFQADLASFTEQHSDVSIYGVSGETGLRRPFLWGTTIEPNVSLAYMRGSIDDAAALGASFRFDDPESLRAGIGARLSGQTHWTTGAWVTHYALSIKAVDDLLASNSMTLGSAGPDLAALDSFAKLFGEVKANLTSDSRNGWSISGGLRYRWNDHYNEEGVTGSVRLRF